MSSLLQAFSSLLTEHGFALLIGTTVILLAFALVVHYSRSLSTKYFAASTGMLALLGYLIVAMVPMPRFGHHDTPPADQTTPPSNPAEHLFAAGQPTGLPEAPPAAEPASRPDRAEEIEALLAVLEPAATEPETGTANSPAMLWLAGLLAAGITIFSAHLLLGMWRLRRILASSKSAPAELTHLIRLPSGTRLRIASAKVQPFCCGLLRPTIVLPHRLAQPSDEARFVLLHERAHLTSGDTRARLLCALLRPVMFWHPLFWWLQQKVRFTSELLADDAAARGSVADYVRCMMTLSTHPDPAAGGALVATIFRRRSELFRRLEMMLQRNEAVSRSQPPLSRWTRAIASVALVAVCAGTFGVDDVVAQSPRSDAVRQQVKELRAELNRLKMEIAELNATTSSRRSTGATSSSPRSRHVRTTNTAGQNPLAEVPSTRSTKYTTHTVKAGDTLSKIAKRYYGSSRRIDAIRRMNPSLDPLRLRVGAKLRIAPVPSTRRAPIAVTEFGMTATGQNPQPSRRRAPRVAGVTQSAPTPLAELVETPEPAAPTRRRGLARFPSTDAPATAPAPATAVVPSEPAPPSAPQPARLPGMTSAPTPPSAGLGLAGGLAGPGVGTGLSTAGPSRQEPSRQGPSRPGTSRPGPAGPRGSRRGEGTPPTPTAPSAGSLAEPPHPTAPGAGFGGQPPRPTAPRARTTPLAATTARTPMPTTGRSPMTLGTTADLITRCIELKGEVEIQEVHVRHAKSKKEHEIAKIRLRTKRQQLDAIRAMLKSHLQAAEQELARGKELREHGFISASELQATASQIKLLNQALR